MEVVHREKYKTEHSEYLIEVLYHSDEKEGQPYEARVFGLPISVSGIKLESALTAAKVHIGAWENTHSNNN